MSTPAPEIQGQVAGALQVQRNVTTSDQFQSLWDKGAFEPPKTPGDKGGVKFDKPAEGKPQSVAKAETAPVPEQSDAEALNAEADAEAGVEPEKTEVPEKAYASLTEFLQDSKIEPDSFLEMPVHVKIDGEERAVPLKDVIKSYQLEGHVNNKSIEYSDKLRALEAETTQVRTNLVSQIRDAQALYQLAEQQLLGDFNRIDWTALRTQNPAEYAALSTEFQQRNALIQQQLQKIQATQQAAAEQSRADMAKRLPEERQKMLDAIPEWRDPAKMTAGREAILAYGKQIGLTEAELGQVFDHRHMRILHDAARYAALQASKPETLRKVRAAPVMARPGARSERDPKAVAKTQALERWSKNPRDTDAQAAYFDTLG